MNYFCRTYVILLSTKIPPPEPTTARFFVICDESTEQFANDVKQVTDGLLVGDGDVEGGLTSVGVFGDKGVDKLLGLLWVGEGVY